MSFSVKLFILDADDFDFTPGAHIMNRLTLGKLLFVGAAFLSFLFSVGLWFSGQREEGVFVGIWVPSILAFGTLMLSGRGGSQ